MRCQCQNLGNVTRDLHLRMTSTSENYSKLPKFLYGHSFGGLIALDYVIKYSEKIDFLMIQAPALIGLVNIYALKMTHVEDFQSKIGFSL